MEKQLSDAIDRGVGWMIDQTAPDGSYKDAMPALGGYYKTPYLWAVSGHPVEFGRAIRYMESVFHGPEGFCSEVDPDAPIYNSHFFGYMMGWVARGAWIGGAFSFAGKAYDYLAEPQGKYITATCDQGPVITNATRNIGSASNAGVSFIYSGRDEPARHCADFVWSVLEQQDVADELFVRTDSDGRVMRDFPEAERAVSVIDLHKPDQMFWYLGIAMAMFAKLYETTGERAMLEKAEAVFNVFDRCRANVTGDDLTVGKVAYGAAVLYRLTGKQCYLTVCRQCAENLIRSQQSEGFWLYDRRGDITGLNRSTLLDFCAELTIWCIEVSRELAQAGPS